MRELTEAQELMPYWVTRIDGLCLLIIIVVIIGGVFLFDWYVERDRRRRKDWLRGEDK